MGKRPFIYLKIAHCIVHTICYVDNIITYGHVRV